MDKSRKRIAVIIPCRNEERNISRCLDSLLANDIDFALLEIVIVDGMSTDRTRDIVAEYVRKHPFIRVIDNLEKNKPAALNLGIRVTSGEIVMRIDAHATYATDYISRLVDGLQAYQAENIGGVRETYAEGTPWEKAVGLVISHRFAAGNAHYRTGVTTADPREVDTVFCGCYRREVFERIGLFHPKLTRTQDREFNARLTASGGKIVLDPGVRCTYYPRTGFGDYARWTFTGAFWIYYAKRFTSTKMRSLLHLVPAVFTAWHAMAALAWLHSQVLFAAAILPILAYWGLAAFFGIQAAVRERSGLLLPALLLLFPTTHYAYGLGSCFGFLTSFLKGREYVQCPDYRSGIDRGTRVAQPGDFKGARSNAA